MAEAKTKKQHFVPRFYLRLFADNNDRFNVLNINKNVIIPEVHYASQCYKRYFYGEEEIWEKRLSKLEYKWSITINKVINGETLFDEDIVSLKELVLFQRQRTNDENNRMLKEREDIIREFAYSVYSQKGWEFDEKAEQFCIERAKKEVSPAENVELAVKMLDYIQDLSVLIIKYNTKELLITSDSPVVALNPFMRFQGFGYNCIGIAYIMPLSPKHLMIVYDGTFYTKYNENLYMESSDSKEVIYINNYEMINAEQLLFSSSDTDLYVNDDVLEHREIELKRNNTQYLGPIGDRLMISNTKGIEYYYELPYIKLHRDYEKIPYNCREAVPREYNKNWEYKLSIKYKTLNNIKKITGGLDNITKSELKQGCRRMLNLAMIYWKNHDRRYHK